MRHRRRRAPDRKRCPSTRSPFEVYEGCCIRLLQWATAFKAIIAQQPPAEIFSHSTNPRGGLIAGNRLEVLDVYRRIYQQLRRLFVDVRRRPRRRIGEWSAAAVCALSRFVA